jgi:hypothetical protein
MHIQPSPMCKHHYSRANKPPKPDINLRTNWELSLTLCIGVGSSDNYAYLVVDDKSKDAVIIDPAHPEECV